MPARSDIEQFVYEWIFENIQDEPFVLVGGTDTRPAEYAANCLSAALDEGFSPKSVEDAFGDLSDYMEAAINTSADREMKRLVAKCLQESNGFPEASGNTISVSNQALNPAP